MSTQLIILVLPNIRYRRNIVPLLVTNFEKLMHENVVDSELTYFGVVRYYFLPFRDFEEIFFFFVIILC